ncbi:MAG: TRAP transporter small permease [Peptococcaceae bacterium]|nr:TRAP transporter small permease [Peptococcaceae bacterium]
MRYPKVWRKIINGTAYISGGLACLLGVMCTVEAIMRYFFKSPTSWSLNICQYMLGYLLFTGSAYAFQAQGHVAVDMIRDFADKRSKGRLQGKRLPRRILAIYGYLMSIFYTSFIFYGVWNLFIRGITRNVWTTENPPIPQWVIHTPMIYGMVLMLITVIFMIMDIIAGGEEFL